MKGVPGVMALESQAFLDSSASSVTGRPFAFHSARAASFSSCFSRASLAARKRRDRCWFILARGATPSIAIMRRRRGRTMLTTRSVYANTSTIISSSVSGAGLPSGCVHGCTIPFISRYKQSNSSPFGLGVEVSSGNGTSVPSGPRAVLGSSSCTEETMRGYFLESHLKRAGTPIFAVLRAATF